MTPLARTLDALLPQTQCTRCGYSACAPYAEAMATGEATHNLCEPGGSALLATLAQVLGQTALPPTHAEPQAHVAWIREIDCIGCARCLPACPVDAILGARRLSHTVIESDCTGCDLCLPACPVDCIELRPASAGWQPPSAQRNRQRFVAHQARLARRHWAVRPIRVQTAASDAQTASPTTEPDSGRATRRAAMIAAAQAAAAARRESR